MAQCHRCPDLAYEFTTEEVLEGTKHFLQYVGYKLSPPPSIGLLEPDFYAQRQDCEILGIVRHDMGEFVSGLIHLQQMKEVLGDKVDYVLALPPVHELWLHDFLASPEGIKWFLTIRRERLLVWLCNPKEMTTCSLFNSPRDKLLNSYFGWYSNLELMGLIQGLIIPFKVTSEGVRRVMKREQQSGLIDLLMFK